MAADYRFPHAEQAASPLAHGAFDWIVLTTESWVGPEEPGVERNATALVNLDRSTSLLPGYGDWTDSITQTQACTGRSGPNAGSLARDPVGEADLVYVHLGHSASSDLELAANLVDRIRARGRALIVLGGTAEQRARLAHASGFIQGRAHRSLADALALLHASHTALTAVHRLSCVDLEDLIHLAGDARQPSRMGEMLWRRDPFELLAGAPADPLLRDSRSALLMPMASGLRLAEITRLVGWLRETAQSPGLDVVWSAPVSMPCAAALPSGVGSAVWVLRNEPAHARPLPGGRLTRSAGGAGLQAPGAPFSAA